MGMEDQKNSLYLNKWKLKLETYAENLSGREVMKDQMNDMGITKQELEEKLSRITTWEEWHDMQESLFRREEWKEADFETMGSQLGLDNVVMDGHEWMPLGDPYDIDREILYLHEVARWYVFEKLEPEAYAENLSRKEDFGKECRFCLRYTTDFDVENCPFCGRKLTLIYVGN